MYVENNVAVLDKFDTNGVSIFSFKKHDFADRVFTLVYRKHSMQMQEFFQMLQYLLAAHLKAWENNLPLNNLTNISKS